MENQMLAEQQQAYYESLTQQEDGGYGEYQAYLQAQAEQLERCQADIKALESVLGAIPAMTDLVMKADVLQALLRRNKEKQEQLQYALGIKPDAPL